MNRLEVAASVGARLVTQLADAGMSAADSTGNLKEPIDDALRALGYAEADLVTAEPEDARGFIAMTRYHALRVVWERIGDRFNVSTSGDSFALNQAFGNVEKLLKAAEGDVIAIFGSLNPSGSSAGIITIDVNTVGLSGVLPVIRPNPLLPASAARNVSRLLGRTRLDLCVIERRGAGRDAGGAPSTGPFTVVQGVECRVSQPGRAPLERVSGQQFGAEADYEIALPPDTQVTNNDRITVNGKTLEVIYVPAAISYGFELKVQAKASS